MREIKFRGIRKDNGEWVYGYHVVFIALTGESNLNGQITKDNKTKIYAIVDENGCVHEIIPETLGQYTELPDKNGKEIYEGDVILLHQFLFDGNEYENQLIGQIIKDDDNACYSLTNIKHEQIQEYMGYKNDYTNFQKECVPINLFYGLHEESFEVIGNIHEEGK